MSLVHDFHCTHDPCTCEQIKKEALDRALANEEFVTRSRKSDHDHSKYMVQHNPKPKLTLEETLWHAFQHFYHLDRSNASFHCNTVRFSPITFRLAEQLWFQFPNLHVNSDLYDVILNVGEYEEDAGR